MSVEVTCTSVLFNMLACFIILLNNMPKKNSLWPPPRSIFNGETYFNELKLIIGPFIVTYILNRSICFLSIFLKRMPLCGMLFTEVAEVQHCHILLGDINISYVLLYLLTLACGKDLYIRTPISSV